MKFCVLIVALGLLAGPAAAEIHTEDFEYGHGDVVLQGYLAYDTEIDGKRPGVLVVHQWMGLGDYEKRRARMLAEMGYVVLAADIYGKGVRASDRNEASQLAGKYRGDRELMRGRVNAGLEALRGHERSDDARLAAIGYCFGGGVVLELARSGADVNGVVSFHGNLDTPDPSDANNISARVLVCHGAADPYVPWEDVSGFRKEMEDAGVDYHLTAYGGAVHSFTHREAGDDPSQGAAYDADADRRSWGHMQIFFDELFQ